MPHQTRTNKYRCNVHLLLETMARVRTYVKGKSVPMESIGGNRILTPIRKMTPNDAIAMVVTKAFSQIKIDKEEQHWMRVQLDTNRKNRARQDALVRAGKYRKPKDKWLKKGMKKGLFYPKVELARMGIREPGREEQET